MTDKDDLPSLYLLMLKMGFIILKEAARSGENEWLEAELELLHNIPTLVFESNKERHLYFWLKERARYLDTMEKLDIPAARSRCATYYAPIWEKMKPHFDQLT